MMSTVRKLSVELLGGPQTRHATIEATDFPDYVVFGANLYRRQCVRGHAGPAPNYDGLYQRVIMMTKPRPLRIWWKGQRLMLRLDQVDMAEAKRLAGWATDVYRYLHGMNLVMHARKVALRAKAK